MPGTPYAGDIFQSQNVLVWLGPMDQAGLLSNVCASIQELHKFLSDFDPELSREERQSLVAEMADTNRREGRPNTAQHVWNAITELLGRPWFTRKWVVKEVAMAQELRLYIGGGIQLPWVDLTILFGKIDLLGVYPLLVRQQGSEDHVSLGVGLWQILTMQDVAHSRVTEQGTLVDAVMATRGFLCSDPRDHIYGLLSCASKGPTLDPDYTLSVEATFKRFAQVMLKERQNLKVLSLEPHKGDRIHPGVPRNRTKLPSWVPDLRRLSVPMAVSSVQVQLFRAGGSRNPVLALSDDGRFLRCQGIIVDEVQDFVLSIHEMIINELPEVIKTTSPHGVADPCLQSRQRRTHQWMRACYDLGYSQASVFEKAGRKNAFSCALLCDQGSNAGGLASAKMVNAAFEYMEYVLFQHYTLPSEQKLNKTSQKRPRVPKLRAAVEHAVAGRCTTRNFSVTTGGRLGQMPIGTERGDLVCVLIGGEVPFVIRPTDHDSTSYHLIGDCFLNGVMNGEMLVANEHATREIVLA
jgi:hypothetical protein